jgi:hypothetical protein
VAFEKVKPGDFLVCYVVKLSRWSGVLEVSGTAFEDGTPIFADENDPFPIRFKVRPLAMLDFEHAIPIEELWDQLSFTKSLTRGAVGWAQAAKLRASLAAMIDEDGMVIKNAIIEQDQIKRVFELDASDRRHIGQRTVIRTEQGEVEVEVPDRQEEEEEEESEQEIDAPVEVRASLKVQAKLAELGATLGFSIWVPPGDRTKITALVSDSCRANLVTTLPLNYDLATLKTTAITPFVLNRWENSHQLPPVFPVLVQLLVEPAKSICDAIGDIAAYDEIFKSAHGVSPFLW